ncbi:MAG: hypothetical protein AB7F40_00140 [Victivallaceae bacterium]|nr:hypothetical protein [Victivallaceae bacterium]
MTEVMEIFVIGIVHNNLTQTTKQMEGRSKRFICRIMKFSIAADLKKMLKALG